MHFHRINRTVAEDGLINHQIKRTGCAYIIEGVDFLSSLFQNDSAMKPIGKIKAILNEDTMLIASEEKLSEDEVLIVYSEVLLTEELQQKLGIEKITINKGYIVVGVEQGENLYLGERCRLTETIRKYEPPAWSSSFSSLLGGHTVEQTVPGGWSVDIDKKQSLGIEISKKVRIDDFISKQ